MKTPFSLLNEAEIRAALQQQNVQLELLGSVNSTNDFPREHGSAGGLQFRLAEHQSKGRGRFGRTWLAPFAANILLSCRFSLQQDLSHLGGLSLCVGLALLKALQELGIEELACKWPNDLLYRDQKLAGILIEVQAEAHDRTTAIIGIGLNVNMPVQALLAVDRPITSLQAILGKPQNRNQIAAKIINSLSQYLQRFGTQGFADFKAEWEAHDALHGKEIELHLGTESRTGTVAGIDASGHLLLKLASGEITAYSAGEVSLSKV